MSGDWRGEHERQRFGTPSGPPLAPAHSRRAPIRTCPCGRMAARPILMGGISRPGAVIPVRRAETHAAAAARARRALAPAGRRPGPAAEPAPAIRGRIRARRGDPSRGRPGPGPASGPGPRRVPGADPRAGPGTGPRQWLRWRPALAFRVLAGFRGPVRAVASRPAAALVPGPVTGRSLAAVGRGIRATAEPPAAVLVHGVA